MYLLLTSAVFLELILQAIYFFSPDKTYAYTLFSLPPDKTYWEGLIRSIPEDGYYSPDQTLGWTLNRNSVYRDSLYVSNSIGIRSTKDFNTQPEDGVLRIALFGDSFTHGDNVYNSETWGSFLHNYLDQQGIKNEVLNYGVSAYGLGQAYLRFKEEANAMKPDVVVLGFQIENIWRALNVFRPNYYLYSGFPFTKPRPIVQNDSLIFINVPTVPVDSIPAMVSDWDRHPLNQYEYFQHNTIYVEGKWMSRLFIVKIIRSWGKTFIGSHRENYAESVEAHKVAQAILTSFKQESDAIDARFIVLQLPLEEDILEFQQTGAYPYAEFTQQLLDGFDFVLTDTLLSKYPVPEVFHGHYSPFGNQLVGEYVGNWMVEYLTLEN